MGSKNEGVEQTAPAEIDPLAAVEAKREKRKAEAEKAYRARLAVDLEAIDELEAQLGDCNVATIRVNSPEGLPCAVACRCPKPVEIKRFREESGERKDARNREVKGDMAAALEKLALVCLVYPDREVYANLLAARPGLGTQLGKEAVKLAVGAEESEGKG